jgi:HEAT repeat protein
MEDPDEKRRTKAVRTFFGKGKLRNRALRRPDLVPRLVALFYRSKDPAVRCACVSGLTEYAEDGDAPAPLFDALSDPDPSVFLQGVFALHYFPDPRALDPLCRFIESRTNVLYNENAMSRLGQMGDDRAVPALVGVLLDTSNTFDQSFGSAGSALGRCGPRGVDALIAALDHPDPRVRRAAVVGLDTSGDIRAAAHLDRMESDPDATVRERARVRLGKPPW